MQIKVFTIPMVGGEKQYDEMNVFLRSKKILQVENFIVNDKIEEALNLLRGAQFKEDDDAIKLLQQLNTLQRQFSVDGTLRLEDYRVEKNRITEGVMKVLKEVSI